MKTEYEVKILDSNFDDVKQKLTDLGGICLQQRRMMKRYILDYADRRLLSKNAYIRVRDEGDRITTSYKQTNSAEIDGVKEIVLDVSGSSEMIELYEQIGIEVQAYQETYRESWLLDGAEIEFDEWPWLESFFEIEATSEQKVREIVKKLGYEWKDAIPGDLVQLYQRFYDVKVNEIARDVDIKFGPVPDWLEAKRR